jgi:hypothetical protein
MFNRKKKILLLMAEDINGSDRIINLENIEMISREGGKIIFYFSTYRYETIYDDVNKAKILLDKVFKILTR